MDIKTEAQKVYDVDRFMAMMPSMSITLLLEQKSALVIPIMAKMKIKILKTKL